MFFSKRTQKQTCKAVKQVFQLKGLKRDAIYLEHLLFFPDLPQKILNSFKITLSPDSWDGEAIVFHGQGDAT